MERQVHGFNYEKEIAQQYGIILNDNYLLNIKNSLSNGAIISLKVNNSLSNELDAVIDYINHKGYDIVNLDILINE